MNGPLNTRRFISQTAALFLVWACASCTSTEPERPDTIPADRFIDTYVELRVTALSNSTGEITAAQRDSILSASGVLSNEMVEFAEVHGRRAIYMQEVWDSVEVRFQRRRSGLNAGLTESPPSTQ